jgi:hypothetical protein
MGVQMGAGKLLLIGVGIGIGIGIEGKKMGFGTRNRMCTVHGCVPYIDRVCRLGLSFLCVRTNHNTPSESIPIPIPTPTPMGIRSRWIAWVALATRCQCCAATRGVWTYLQYRTKHAPIVAGIIIVVGIGIGIGIEGKKMGFGTRNRMCTVHRSRMSAGPIVSVREDQPPYTVGIDPDPDSDPDTDGNQEQMDRPIKAASGSKSKSVSKSISAVWASVRLDTDVDFDFEFDFKWGKPQLGLCA